MAQSSFSMLQQPMKRIAKSLWHPRRKVDDQGRSVQFQQWSGLLTVSIVMMDVFGVLFIVMGVLFLTSNSSDKYILFAMFFGVALMSFLISYYIYRLSRVTYYEDEYGFELLTPFLRKRVSISYADITSWTIVTGYRGVRFLVLKTNNKKRVSVPLRVFRPLLLLNALLEMEKAGRFRGHTSGEQRNRAIRTLGSEFCMHANKVREEMEKTGATIYIPER